MQPMKPRPLCSDIVRASFAAGSVFALLAVAIGGGLGRVPVSEAVVFGTGYFLVTYAALRIGCKRALVLLWLLLLVLWAAFLHDIMSTDRRSVTVTALIGEPFLQWSLFGMPLAAATAVFLRFGGAHRPRSKFLQISVVSIWIFLLTRFSPDVTLARSPAAYAIVWAGLALICPMLVSMACIRIARLPSAPG